MKATVFVLLNAAIANAHCEYCLSLTPSAGDSTCTYIEPIEPRTSNTEKTCYSSFAYKPVLTIFFLGVTSNFIFDNRVTGVFEYVRYVCPNPPLHHP